MVSFVPWLFYPQEKSLWNPLDRRLGVPHSWSGHSGEEKKVMTADFKYDV
jgi:hypothetical protein